MDITLKPEAKIDAMEEIKKYHIEERDQAISDFQAENFLLFILKTIGPVIYNQAIEDAYALMAEKTEELYGLQKRSR